MPVPEPAIRFQRLGNVCDKYEVNISMANDDSGFDALYTLGTGLRVGRALVFTGVIHSRQETLVDVGLMMGQRRRRWASIRQTLF